MCFICGRSNCIPAFHSIEEQLAFSEAEIAYDNYINIKKKCEEAWEQRVVNEEDDEDDAGHH